MDLILYGLVSSIKREKKKKGTQNLRQNEVVCGWL